MSESGSAVTNLLILGVYLKSEGYPNVKYRVQALKDMVELKVTEVNFPMWSEKQVGRGGIWSKLILSVWRTFFSHLVILYHYIRSCPTQTVYIPYPAVFVVFILSCLPKRYRPKKLVIDVFISLYDTIVNDRKLVASNSMAARVLKKIEKKAFEFSDIVVTDTLQNSVYYSELFDVPLNKFIAIPLSTNEHDMKPLPYMPDSNTVKVLFVGTLVPLHGIETILGAISLLDDSKNIEFTIIGDGQDGQFIEEYLKEHPGSITWVKTWQSASQIASYIYEADICLGIFGRGAKSQRVCPYKIYSYASCGRAIITGETDWTRSSFDALDLQPIRTTPVGNTELLADAILKLSVRGQERKLLADSAAIYYSDALSNAKANSAFYSLL